MNRIGRGFGSCLMVLALYAGAAAGTASSAGPALSITVSGHIDPLQAHYLKRALQQAKADGAPFLIMRLDTPGGLDVSMREMIKDIMASPVPVIAFVAPNGARAASAGAFLTLASHASAMAPQTNLGAAHPVNVTGEKASDKVTNDAAAFIRSIAQKRGKDVALAEAMVTRSISMTALEALKKKMIDAVAVDVEALLSELDGRKIETAGGPVILRSRGARVRELPMGRKDRFLHDLANPNVAYILFLLGVYGMIYELASPGAVLPGVVGAICLLLSFMAFSNLPVNLVGLLLLGLSIGLFILDIKSPTHGVLTAGGAIALLLGSFMLYNSPAKEYSVSMFVIISITLITVLFFVFVVRSVLQAHRRPVEIGSEIIVGAVGYAVTELNPRGIVHVQGEEWNAVVEEGTIAPDAKVRVVGKEELVLKVKRL